MQSSARRENWKTLLAKQEVLECQMHWFHEGKVMWWWTLEVLNSLSLLHFMVLLPIASKRHTCRRQIPSKRIDKGIALLLSTSVSLMSITTAQAETAESWFTPGGATWQGGGGGSGYFPLQAFSRIIKKKISSIFKEKTAIEVRATAFWLVTFFYRVSSKLREHYVY